MNILFGLFTIKTRNDITRYEFIRKLKSDSDIITFPDEFLYDTENKKNPHSKFVWKLYSRAYP